MPENYLIPIDLNKNEIRNAVIHLLASAPPTPVEGQTYYNTTDHHLYVRTNSAWQDLGDAITFAGQNQAYYLNRGNHTGSQAQSSITNLVTDLAAKAPLSSPAFTDTPTAPTATAGTNTTQLATTAYVIAEIAARFAANDAMTYKGAIDCSTNPNYPAANSGDTYRISVAGKIGGVSGITVEVGDMAICHVDASSAGNHATVGANWDVLQTNLIALSDENIVFTDVTTNNATTLKHGFLKKLSGNANEFLDGTGNWTVPSGSVLRYVQTVGNGSDTSIVVTHNLGSRDLSVILRDTGSPYNTYKCGVTMTSTNTVTLDFSIAPTTNQYTVAILG